MKIRLTRELVFEIFCKFEMIVLCLEELMGKEETGK
jgi:hypothetical protein